METDTVSVEPRWKRYLGLLCEAQKTASNFITSSLENYFYRLGKVVSGSPWITIFISLAICGVCLLGVLKFTKENRVDKLWTPQDSTVQRHKLWIQKNFPAQMRVSSVLLVAVNVLTPEVMKEALMVYEKGTKIDRKTKHSWENICFRIGPICLKSGLLELWSFDEAVINRLTREDILEKINQEVIISPMTRKKFDLSKYIGGIKRNSTGHVVAAEATTLLFGIKFNPKLNAKEGRLEDKVVEKWETEFNKLMDTTKTTNAKLYYMTKVRYEGDVDESIQDDIILLSCGYILVTFYASVMLGNFSRMNTKVWLALFGVLCVGLSIGVSFGIASAFGVFYGPIHSALPFLLLGVGVDDIFVIVQAWSNLAPEICQTQPIQERLGLTLKHAGCSITITTLTDFLVFLIGSTTLLPALRAFCIYAAIGVLADFILQVTLFTALLAIDARRQKKKRDGLCCCCITLPDNYRESSLAKKDFLKTIMDKIGAAMLSLPGKVFVIVITGALFGFNLYGAIMLKLSFDQNRFLPPDSMSYKYKFTNSKYFPVNGASVKIYTGKFDYFKEQDKLHRVYDIAVSDKKYIVSSSINSWYEDFVSWAIDKKPGKCIQKRRITNETCFYPWLGEFLRTSGLSYQSDIRTENGTGQLPLQILASQIRLRHRNLDSTREEVKAMENLRDKIKTVFPNDSLGFPFSPYYFTSETNKIISTELYRNTGLALLTVLVATAVVLPSLRTCFLVFSCVGFTLVGIMGTIHFWGLTIDIVTTICVVLAIGLSVDYSSHIGHTFMIRSGTRKERALITLRDMGPAVWNGGFSTYIAVGPLVLSNSYPTMTFFKVFLCVVFYGLFHGLCYLPVLLSLIGPSPYNSSEANTKQSPSSSKPDDSTDCKGAYTNPTLATSTGDLLNVGANQQKFSPLSIEDLDATTLVPESERKKSE
nr:NPC1-like intracellular cholesterol transporter 1 [Pocillopora verrucosa]